MVNPVYAKITDVPHRVGAETGVVNDFVSRLNSTGGIAQPNRYKVQFGGVGPNAAVRSLDGIDSLENVSMMCESIQMPGRNIRSVEDPLRYGPQREQAQGVTFGSVNARFICSSDLRERVFFETWQDMMFNEESWEMRFYKDFIGDVTVHQLDRQLKERYGLKLKEVFPKIINQQELGYIINDNYQTVTVELMFHSWEKI